MGDALADDMPIAHRIEQFESEPTRTSPANTQALANDLLHYFRSFQAVPSAGLLVVGYDRLDPWVLTVNVQDNTVDRRNFDTQNNQIIYRAAWAGDKDIVSRLLAQPGSSPPYHLMNLQDAVDFSRHLIRSTIDQMRFEPRFPSVGGSIDTLVVTSSGAAFVARKSLTCS